MNVLIAFLPAVVLGLMLGKTIQSHLFTPSVVATAFVVGGLIILWAEARHRPRNIHEHTDDRIRIHHVENMSPRDALKVGLVQCLAMIPGTSRSGATFRTAFIGILRDGLRVIGESSTGCVRSRRISRQRLFDSTALPGSLSATQ